MHAVLTDSPISISSLPLFLPPFFLLLSFYWHIDIWNTYLITGLLTHLLPCVYRSCDQPNGGLGVGRVWDARSSWVRGLAVDFMELSQLQAHFPNQPGQFPQVQFNLIRVKGTTTGLVYDLVVCWAVAEPASGSRQLHCHLGWRSDEVTPEGMVVRGKQPQRSLERISLHASSFWIGYKVHPVSGQRYKVGQFQHTDTQVL